MCKLRPQANSQRLQRRIWNTGSKIFVRNDFYVDNCLKSVDSVSNAISSIQGTKDLRAQGGLRLNSQVRIMIKLKGSDREHSA